MVASYRWIDDSGSTTQNPGGGAVAFQGGVSVVAPESVQRVVFRCSVQGMQDLVNPGENLSPAPKHCFASVTLQDETGDEIVWLETSPMSQYALYLPAGSSRTPHHSFYWNGPPMSFDAQVRRVAPPPPSNGLIVGWQIAAQDSQVGGPGNYESAAQFWAGWQMRVLVSQVV